MSMLLEIHPESGFLSVVATGQFSLEEAKRTFLQILEAISISKSTKVLVDGRELMGEPEFIERFYYGKFAAQKTANFSGVSPLTLFAYVLKEPIRDPKRFGENVAVNRGMRVKVFDTPDEALRWLGITSDNKPDAGHDSQPR